MGGRDIYIYIYIYTYVFTLKSEGGVEGGGWGKRSTIFAVATVQGVLKAAPFE